MKGMLIPTNGNPVEIDIEVDEMSRVAGWQRDATPAHRHSTTTPSCRYIESHHGRKVGKHHGI